MLVAIEGIDGAGKRTQAALLRQAASDAGLATQTLSFPRYGETLFGDAVADYLNGRFGELTDVPPPLVALLYAGDRFESRALLDRLDASLDLLILDRYVASNLAYQAARLDPHDRPGLIAWIARVEYEVFGLPGADLTFFLDVPVATASALVTRKGERSYTTAVADLHERDTALLANCRDVYRSLAAAGFRSEWHVIDCLGEDGTLDDAATIHARLWAILRPRLDVGSKRESAPAGQARPGST